MYVVTSIWLVRRTRATLRSAEFGFFGVWVKTRTQTPRFCGLSLSAGLLVLVTMASRPLRTSWLMVGTRSPVATTATETGPDGRRPPMHRARASEGDDCPADRWHAGPAPVMSRA